MILGELQVLIKTRLYVLNSGACVQFPASQRNSSKITVVKFFF
jgi:uncharacterized cupin superfamily protein